jgi:hypothetical protein
MSQGTRRTLQYLEQRFEFEAAAGGAYAGRLLLSVEDRELLRRLQEAEAEDWYLDQHGERLAEEALFTRSPWSEQRSDGRIKLLIRSLNLMTGEARFSAPETYEGETWAWLRGR